MTRPPRPRPPYNPRDGVRVVPADRPGIHRDPAAARRAARTSTVIVVTASGSAAGLIVWAGAPWWVWGCAMLNLAAALVLTAVVWVATAR